MRILVSGASGLVGKALSTNLVDAGHEVVALSRSPGPATIVWDPRGGRLDPAALHGFDAVVHLAGESVAGRWTTAKRERIRQSRIAGTRLLAQTLAELPSPPGVFVCASAVGYYGDRGDEVLDERSPPGQGFLSEVACQWEAEADTASLAGIRTVLLRFGIILSSRGGALEPMVRLTWFGVGGPLGSGRQFWSWISLTDVVRVIDFSLRHDSLAGPVNVVSPEPIRQVEFQRRLSRVMHRPALIPAPKFALRLALGDMANGLLLASCRAIPTALTDHGFEFHEADLSEFLGREL